MSRRDVRDPIQRSSVGRAAVQLGPDAHPAVPGKRSLVEALVQRKAGDPGPSGAAEDSTQGTAGVPAANASGVSSGAGPLRGIPIQCLFGRHDMDDAQAHTDGSAASGGHAMGAQASDAPLPAPGSGAPMPEHVQAKMEDAFDADFSSVRIHQDARPAQLGALAYTQGTDIHFAPGQYQPETPSGQELLGHELAHVVQQAQGRVAATTQAKSVAINEDSALEREADVLGARAARGERATLSRGGGDAGRAAATQVRHAARPGAPAQFGRRDRKKKQRERKQLLRQNEQRIDPHRSRLKAIGRELRDLAVRVRAGAGSKEAMAAAHDLFDQLPQLSSRVQEREAEVGTIQRDSGVDCSSHEVTPPILENARVALAQARQAIKAAKTGNPFTRIESLFAQATAAAESEDFDLAYKLLAQIEGIAGSLGRNEDEETWTYKELTEKLVAAGCPGGRILQGAYADAILLPDDKAVETLHAAIENRYRGPQKAEEREQLKNQAPPFLRDFKKTPGFIKAIQSVTRELAGRAKEGARKQYDAQPTPMLQDPEFKEAYIGMAAAKGGVTDVTDEAQLKTSLVTHLQLPVKSKNKSIDEILKEGISKKSERLQFLFEDSPGLLEQCKKLIVDESLHRTLEQIKSGGKPHSIKDINDYVGDKLNEPLMRWVIDKGIPLEVHATSLLASFAKMRSEGFTDIIEIPSTHTGTKKWVCANPKTKKAKVVFQTLPGESYAIQTAGAFLFYEIYDIAPQVKAQLGAESVTPTEDVGSAGTFTHPGYKARNQIAHDQGAKLATFLLVPDKQGKHLAAEVSYAANPPRVGSGGEIVLGASEAEPRIALKEVDVRSIPESQLSIFKEDVDYKEMYKDIMATHGVTAADIACIGRKSALRTALSDKGVAPAAEVTLPHFNMAVFYLTGEESAVTLLGFSVSPEFFGDKSGHLVKALQEIGVKHITFVGTAGGLLGDSKVGDIMIPRRLKNFSTGSMGTSELPNAASGLMGEFAGSDKVSHDSFRSEDLHVGVHSPITESQEMIDAMKERDVSSVDCEAGFIADALQGSKVSLYALFFIGDVPGTHESIGMGGVSGEVGGDVGGEEREESQTAPTEQAILYIIQKIIGREISKAQKEIEQSLYPLAGKEITGLTVLGGTPGKGKLVLDAKLPKTAKTGEGFTGVLKTFHSKLAAILEEASGVVDGKVQGKIFQLVQSFRDTHGILILIDYDQG